MEQSPLYKQLKDYLETQVRNHNLLEEMVLIRGKVLSTEEAIGKPYRQDFPLLKGKEKLIQAEFKGALGQAFTDSPDGFSGTLKEFLDRPLENNFQRAAFIAVLNAVMRYLGLVEGTVHCKDAEPQICGEKLVEYIRENYTEPKIAIIGLQPALLEHCNKEFNVRVVDLDPDNIGKRKCGVLVEDAEEKTQELLYWCDLLLVTGSTAANGTIINFLNLNKPTIFYGTTVAGAAKILDLKRFCECSK